MARKPMPKALSPLQSVQRSYTSELLQSGVVFGEGVVGVVGEFLSWRSTGLVSKERKEGNLEFAGYQGCSVTMAAELL
jgi:hypothetical protein